MEAFNNLGISFSGILIYLVNFGLLILILTKFLYKPAIGFLDKRKATIEKNLKEAELIKVRFEEEMSKKEAETNKLLADMKREISQTKEIAEKQASDIIKAGEERKKKLIEEGRDIIKKMKDQFGAELENDIMNRIEKVLHLVLRDHVSKDVIKKSIKEEWESLENSKLKG